MERSSNAESALRQAIEVCRPHRFDPAGRDVRQPEIAALAAELELDPRLVERRSRIEAIDSAIAAAIEQGPVPEGLADRLLARLQAAAAAEDVRMAGGQLAAINTGAGGQTNIVIGPADPVEQVLSLAARRTSDSRTSFRRRVAWLAGAAALAAACLAGVWAWRPLAPLGYEQIVALANEFDDAAPDDAWKPLAKRRPLKGYSISSAISATPLRWRAASAFLGRSGVAYDITSRTGARATLYVVPLDRVGGSDFDVPYDSLPSRPRTTGGKLTAAWTDGTTLWVLVVRGGQGEYRSFEPRGVA